jgi:hypothetical protein
MFIWGPVPIPFPLTYVSTTILEPSSNQRLTKFAAFYSAARALFLNYLLKKRAAKRIADRELDPPFNGPELWEKPHKASRHLTRYNKYFILDI